MKQPNMLTPRIARIAFGHILRGILRTRQGHLAPAGHVVPAEFCGVCVATSEDSATDELVIARLGQLGIRQVRLDFAQGELSGFNPRFLESLLAAGHAVHLHLVQPFALARQMESDAAQAEWRAFLQEVLDRFGRRVQRVEIGTTINRKRWAGYTMPGFLSAWQIAFEEVKARQITLAGPNVTDFEPIYNIGLLEILRDRNQLPDIHTNNLFSERVSEPERFDHRILKYRWATLLRYNLIKKARILQQVGAHFGVEALMSPAAFWAIYRIERLLPDGKQKQADYAARYMILCAASGALRQAFWGAFICHREGLIDDGLQDSDYPPLERIAHYQSIAGDPDAYRLNPSFHAFRQAAGVIQGARYSGARASAKGLEIHCFESDSEFIHAIWTINGKAAFLTEIYSGEELLRARWQDRGGISIPPCALATESPVYLRWSKMPGRAPRTGLEPALRPTPGLSIHRHVEGLQYYEFRQNDWRGLILAKDSAEAGLLAEALDPRKLRTPEKRATLRHARNAIWSVEDPRDAGRRLTIKQPVKFYPHKRLLDRFKPSKAMRSWSGAMELLRRGVATAGPVAYFERLGDTTLRQNFYICEHVQADCTVGEVFLSLAKGASDHAGIGDEEIYVQLAQYLRTMHDRGGYFRDLSGGNVLMSIGADRRLAFSLIDTGRARFFNHPTPHRERIADMTRICNKLHWEGRERLMRHYHRSPSARFGLKEKWPFHLYDLKVWLKRRVGRKGIKKLVAKIRGRGTAQ